MKGDGTNGAGDLGIVPGKSGVGLVGHFRNPLTDWAVRFRADGVARTSCRQVGRDMLGARALAARKIPSRLRERIYETAH